jgi:oligoribonuclease (3'-5' exoribonuclease)
MDDNYARIIEVIEVSTDGECRYWTKEGVPLVVHMPREWMGEVDEALGLNPPASQDGRLERIRELVATEDNHLADKSAAT